MKVNETFLSLQGEGYFTGKAAFFLDDNYLKYQYPDWKVVRKNF